MSDRIVLEYALNALWQVPLVTGATWLFLRAARLTPLAEHRLWLAVLAVCVLLPAHGIERTPVKLSPNPVQTGALAYTPLTETFPTVSLPVSDSVEPSPEPEAALPATPPSIAPFWRPRISEMHLSPRAVRSLTWIYASVVLFAGLRLVRGSLSARQLLSDSQQYAMNEAEDALWHELTSRFELALSASSVRTSDLIASPVVLGIFTPTLLLPQDFHLCAESERRAALCHELAHIQRRDCLTHTACQVMALPLVWHPLMHLVQTQIARTREMICDSIAAREMRSDVAYARCLLGLAQRMLRTGEMRYAGEGMGLFRSNKLEERVMKLTELKHTMSAAERWLRRTGGTAALGSAIMAAALFHLTPVMAQARIPSSMMSPAEAVALIQAAQPPAAAPLVSRSSAPIAPSAPRAPRPLPEPEALATQEPSPAPTPAPTPLPALVSSPAPLAPVAPLPPLSKTTTQTSTQTNTLINESPSYSIAHGDSPHLIIIKNGSHVHRWIGADGKSFELMNDQAADLTPQQQRDAEAEYNQRLVQSQKELEKVRSQLNSPEFKHQMSQLSNGELARQLAQSQKLLAEQSARFNSPEFKAQLDQLTSGAIQKQLAESEARMSEQLARINSNEWNLQTQKQIAAALAQIPKIDINLDNLKIDEAMRSASATDSVALQKRLANAQARIDLANKRMQEAAQSLARAQKQYDEEQKQLEQSKPIK